MKRIIIAMAVACAAVVANAATAEWTWSTSGTAATQVWYDNSTSALLPQSTLVYLFDADVVSQDTILADLRSGSKSSLSQFTSVSSTSINENNKLTSITTPTIKYGLKPTETEIYTYNFYMAALDAAGNLFLLDDKPFSSSGLADPGSISFSGIKAATQVSWTSDPTKTFAVGGSGWYAAAPEPTSGLMLLLGVGLMALKRKRA